MPRCGWPARRAVSRRARAHETNPALSVNRKHLGTSKRASHPARPVPAVAPHGPRCSADVSFTVHHDGVVGIGLGGDERQADRDRPLVAEIAAEPKDFDGGDVRRGAGKGRELLVAGAVIHEQHGKIVGERRRDRVKLVEKECGALGVAEDGNADDDAGAERPLMERPPATRQATLQSAGRQPPSIARAAASRVPGHSRPGKGRRRRRLRAVAPRRAGHPARRGSTRD